MIGIFDSGLGGLTALKEIHKLLPKEKLVYFGDTGRVPYGTRSKEIIIKYARQDIGFLLSKGVDTIVAACGTVSANASLSARSEEIGIPVIGVVNSAAEAAVRETKNNTIGVIGTPATINSGAFNKKIAELDSRIKLVTKACPMLVPLVENGYIENGNKITRLVCEEYLQPIKESGADTLILGCTHYPIISGIIQNILPSVKLISTGAEAAKTVALMKKAEPESGKDEMQPDIQYFVSDDPALFKKSASIFLGHEFSGEVSKIDIDAVK